MTSLPLWTVNWHRWLRLPVTMSLCRYLKVRKVFLPTPKWCSSANRLRWKWVSSWQDVSSMLSVIRLTEVRKLKDRKWKSVVRQWIRCAVNSRRNWLQRVLPVSTWITHWYPVRRFRSSPTPTSLSIRWWQTWHCVLKQIRSFWAVWVWRTMTTSILRMYSPTPVLSTVLWASWIRRKILR